MTISPETVSQTEDDAGAMEALLKPYVAIREQKQPLETALDAWGKRLKAWLQAHPGEQLIDGEHNIVAELQTRRGTPQYDLITLAERDPVLFERLLKTGCLRVDHKSVQAQQGQVGGTSIYIASLPETEALQVSSHPGKGLSSLDMFNAEHDPVTWPQSHKEAQNGEMTLRRYKAWPIMPKTSARQSSRP